MNTYDVIIVGGGHAGVEAAYAAAKMGSRTLLVTLDPKKLATMPCNPSIGGLGKGHIVFEVSALGGLMPQLCTQTYLQARMLNTRKGPAVQGLRLQIDKYAYSTLASKRLAAQPNLTIVADMVVEILYDVTPAEAGVQSKNSRAFNESLDPGLRRDDNSSAHSQPIEPHRRITGIKTALGTTYLAPSVVITTGTFLNGLVHIGKTRYRAGRRGEAAAYGLSQSIATAIGTTIDRLKTGTPPRLLKSSLDYSQFTQQPSEPLDSLFEFDPVAVHEKIPCFVTTTNQTTHDIITNNLQHSALYSGNIKGTGPRYCPSIEDKVGRYPDRPSHHVFIEPEGADIDEIYPAGLSTSLPLDVQRAYIRSIDGFQHAEIATCGYAIEYDFIQPNNLTHTLEAKTVAGLFLAGQINGTTGYEEAAGQGLIAGINAHLKAKNSPPFVLSRSESYIGVMIDDLVTLGTNEPYRMFTSRAERRLLLRQDNVFLRLMPYGKQLGLVDDEQYKKFLDERAIIEAGVAAVIAAGTHSVLHKALLCIEFTPDLQHQARELLTPLLTAKGLPVTALSSRALLSIHAEIKYAGYLDKERREVEKTQRYQDMVIPAAFVYDNLPGLSKELQHKLTSHKPQSIAHAQLIPGMTPAAISVLIFQVRMVEKQSVATSVESIA